ncbi:MAG: hypothetical protein ACK2UA_10975 [Anaerolineae bacterium]
METMALYLVRWPDLSCTLVTARDEDHLVDLLDEVGNPEGCRWTEYDGPLFIDFHLPVRITIDWPEQAGRPLSPEAVQIEDLDRLAQREGLQADVGAGDTAGEMLATIMRFAFPATAAEMDCDAPDEVLEESQLRAALRADLRLLAESSWRQAHTERTADDDALAMLAVAMDAPMRLAKRWQATAAATLRGDQDEHAVVDGAAEDQAGRLLPPLELLDFETDRSQTLPLRGHPELTLRDEANAITAHVFRNGFLEDLHSGLPSPLVTNPRFARITDAEVKKLMIESSAKLAHWLCLRELLLEEKPEAYYQLLRAVAFRASRNWEREAQSCEISEPTHNLACASCNYPLHPEWQCCPVCARPV